MSIPFKNPEGGLREDSFIMCEQVKSISTERLVKLMGTVSETTMRRAEKIIVDMLGLYDLLYQRILAYSIFAIYSHLVGVTGFEPVASCL